MTNRQRRELVIGRDKKCRECGSTENLTVDHIIPLSRGGTNESANLQALCTQCNTRKGNKIRWDWWERIMIAFHVDDIITRTKNELKSLVLAEKGNLKAELLAAAQSNITKLRNEITEKDAVVDKQAAAIALLHERIRALETYLKIQYISDTQTIITKEYRKIPKNH